MEQRLRVSPRIEPRTLLCCACPHPPTEHAHEHTRPLTQTQGPCTHKHARIARGQSFHSRCAGNKGGGANLITTMLRSSYRMGTPGIEKPWTRLTCRSSSFLSCTFKLCELVLLIVRGVKSVPFKQTRFLVMDSSTSSGTSVLGSPVLVLPDKSGNLSITQQTPVRQTILTPPPTTL